MRVATMFLVLSVAGLLTLGVVMQYSAVIYGGNQTFLFKQLCWTALGLFFCLMVAIIDYRWLKDWFWLLLGVAVVLLALVLHPDFGTRINGARRWFVYGWFSFQPSECAKLALITFVAWYGDRYRRYMPTFWQGLVIPGLMISSVLGLIFVEPDWGATILLGAVSVVMLLVAGARWKFVVPLLIGAAALLVILLILDPVRSERLRAWFNPEMMKDDAGYQVWQSLLALGSGGLEGLGLGNGRQKLGFLPLHQTDFIFPLIGEELGLVATMGVILVFAVLIVSGVFIAAKARDNFGFLLGSGITFLIGLQAFVNIGVVTNTLPNKGLALPFISYGGSSLLMMLVSVGVLISIARRGGKSQSLMAPVTVESEPMPA
ncbi:MAG: putative peptidoglycan glycosyltransferase FtsW [Verrucomicrobia subdivision 3 bacterium]|nr:putative peptidoglycan glycosyltransferase FtsW [Limisphaerales bacterium]MCS1412386.1 putative peptidoglycan glycosyltransferase FtsW [Limisphaerales bacterium]